MAALESHVGQERLQDLCASAWAGRPAACATRPATCPRSARSRCRRWSPTCRGPFARAFFKRSASTSFRSLSPRELEWSGRLTQPLYAGPIDTHYRAISWDEALTRLADRLKRQQPDESFFYASGRSSNEAGFLLQLFARLYGTNYVNNCSFYCHQASGVGLTTSLGTGTATVTLEDVEHADLFFLIGGNPASNHPRLLRTLMQIRRNGGEVIVINPLKEVGLVNFRVPSDVRSMLFGSKIASLYVQPHIGGDIALLTGVAKLLLERGQVRRRLHRRSHRGLRRVSPAGRVDRLGRDRTSQRRGPRDRSSRSPIGMPRPRTPCSPGRWASLTTRTALRTSG